MEFVDTFFTLASGPLWAALMSPGSILYYTNGKFTNLELYTKMDMISLSSWASLLAVLYGTMLVTPIILDTVGPIFENPYLIFISSYMIIHFIYLYLEPIKNLNHSLMGMLKGNVVQGK